MKCPTCKEEIRPDNLGLDDEQCQACWEAYCDRTWWEFMGKFEAALEASGQLTNLEGQQ